MQYLPKILCIARTGIVGCSVTTQYLLYPQFGHGLNSAISITFYRILKLNRCFGSENLRIVYDYHVESMGQFVDLLLIMIAVSKVIENA